METHEYAQIFPMATDIEIKEIADDIKERGQISPIIILDGKILDGRNRFRACQIADVKPIFKEYEGCDPLGDVISWNLKRRHLSTSQKATLAVELKPMYEEKAKERQVEGQERGRQVQRGIVANLPQTEGALARDQAASAVGVSGRIVQDAEHVKKHAPEFFEEIKAGRMTVNAAIKEAKGKEEKTNIHPSVTIDKGREMALRHAITAINELKKIPGHEKSRIEAFKMVKNWITHNQ